MFPLLVINARNSWLGTANLVGVSDVVAEFEARVLFEGIGDVVKIDHHLDDVDRAFLADFDVYDYGLFTVGGDEVWFAGKGLRCASELEAVLLLDGYGVALSCAVEPLCV